MMNDIVANAYQKIRPLIITYTLTHGTGRGDVELANRCYWEYTLEFCKLFSQNSGVELAKMCISDENLNVKAIGAFYLLPYETRYAVKVLRKIKRSHVFGPNIIADDLLIDWRKKRCKFPRLVNGVIEFFDAAEIVAKGY